MNKILAGIITFNPDKELLIKCIDSVIAQVDQLLIIDNNSDDKELLETVRENSKIKVIFNKRNEGVSKAFNKILSYGLKNGYSWCILLDQDSICSENMIDKYKRFIRKRKCQDIGILCPRIYDRNEKNKEENEKRVQRVVFGINSGAFINIRVWDEIGRYDEKLFIDLADYDYSIRINESGYKIIRLNDVVLEHSIGSVTVHKLGGKVYNHSAIRKFYMAQASVYLSNKHKSVRRKYTYLQHVYLRSIKRGMLVLFYEEHKWDKIIAIIQGLKSGRELSRKADQEKKLKNQRSQIKEI